MLKRPTLAASALLIASTATIALAQTVTAPAANRSRDDAAVVQAIQSAKVSLVQAIDIAEQQGGQGSRAVEVEFEAAKADSAGPGRYEVKVLTQDGKVVKYKLDANSGQVVETENERFESLFTRFKPADLQNAQTSLKQALTIAEQRIGAGARAIEAEVERESGTLRYEITVATTAGDGRSQEVTIDAGSGQVVSTKTD